MGGAGCRRSRNPTTADADGVRAFELKAGAFVNAAGPTRRQQPAASTGFPQDPIPPLWLARWQLFRAVGPVALLAADLSGAGRWRPRVSSDARPRRRARLARMSNGSTASTTRSIRAVRLSSTTKSGATGSALRTARCSPAYAGVSRNCRSGSRPPIRDPAVRPTMAPGRSSICSASRPRHLSRQAWPSASMFSFMPGCGKPGLAQCRTTSGSGLPTGCRWLSWLCQEA